jgi:DNA polymerase IIIc chi subunit
MKPEQIAIAGTPVLLFNNCADSNHAARIHDGACPLVAAALRSKGRVKVCPADTATLADLDERGWIVKTCKCVTKG